MAPWSRARVGVARAKGFCEGRKKPRAGRGEWGGWRVGSVAAQLLHVTGAALEEDLNAADQVAQVIDLAGQHLLIADSPIQMKPADGPPGACYLPATFALYWAIRASTSRILSA